MPPHCPKNRVWIADKNVTVWSGGTMISLKRSMSELEKLESLQHTALECCGSVMEAAGRYAVEIEAEQTRRFRKELKKLAIRVKSATAAGELRETRLTFQTELQEYSGKAARYLQALREKLSDATRALSGIVETIHVGEGDDRRLQIDLGRLSTLAQTPEVARVCPELEIVAAAVEDSVSRLRKRNQVVIGQLRSEIEGLRNALENARQAAVRDPISGVLNRAETLARIHGAIKKKRHLSLVFLWLSNLEYIARRYGSHCRDEVIANFSKRLLETTGPEAVAGRWGDDRFVTLIERPKPEAIWIAETFERRLTGPYIVKESDFTREIVLRLKSGVVEYSPEMTETGLMKAADKLLVALESVPPVDS